MNMLKWNKTAGRGLSRAMIMIAGVSALMMIAGSAQAQSADRASRLGRHVSIAIDGDQISLNSVGVALRSGRGVLALAEDLREVVRQGRRDEENTRQVNLRGQLGRHLVGLRTGNRRIRIDPIVIAPPVTAVPEPGAALLFGAGIVLAGLRRQSA